VGPLALLGAFISLAERGIAQPAQRKTVCVLQFNTAASWESAPSQSSGLLNRREAKLLASRIPDFAVLLCVQ
jgi:hypothetical protein